MRLRLLLLPGEGATLPRVVIPHVRRGHGELHPSDARSARRPVRGQIAWRGGEPTLTGIDFFRRAIEPEKEYARPGQRVSNSIQTNGILIVERKNDSGYQEGALLSARTVEPAAYGRFLIEIFNEWVRRDVGTVFVTFFDSVLAACVNGESTLCILRRECGDALALEHNGDLYA